MDVDEDRCLWSGPDLASFASTATVQNGSLTRDPNPELGVANLPLINDDIDQPQ
jgi:hypothetical protein